ncbi:MAG: hypothetical protein M0R80_08880 [Proteobacteria bacterium]|jgi:hypothetical protein|nr:hypothetical protein [Pseudomonadota bacterium]
MEFRNFLETNLTTQQWQSVNNYMVRKGYDWRGAEDAKRIMTGMMRDGEIDEKIFPDHAAALRSLHRKSVERSPDEKLLTRIKRYYGITNNFAVAGYILADGSMLNFSGSNKGAPGDVRGIDHREVGHFLRDDVGIVSGSWAIREFCERFGSMSLHYGNDYANLRIFKMPTRQQIKRIDELHRAVSNLQLGMYRGGGESIYDNGTGRKDKMYGPKDYNYAIDLRRFFGT